MRRLVLLALVVALALPVAAWAAASLPGDGTLVVDNGNGLVTIRARGGILGRFVTGNMVISDLDLADGKVPVVYGAETIQPLGGGRTRYSGDDLRFRMIGGLFRVQINAIGIDVSAVGRGVATLDASGFTDFPGRYSLNGGPFQPLPGHAVTYALGQAPPSPPSVK
ncbi:MAG: hypothetical protein ACM3QU_02400 [Verrucomicrobiota bacterium]